MWFVTNGDDDLVRVKLNIDTSLFFDDAAKRLASDAEHVIFLVNPVLPHSEGEAVLSSTPTPAFIRHSASTTMTTRTT